MLNTFSQQREEQSGVKVHPNIMRLRKLFWTSLIARSIAVCILLLIAIPLLTYLLGIDLELYQLFIAGFVTFCSVLGVIFIPLLLRYRRMMRSLKDFERRRQLASQGDQSLLATEQPAPNAYALSLPFTIKQRVNRYLFLAYLVFEIIPIVIITQALAFYQNAPNVMIGMVVIGILISCIFGLVIWKLYAISRVQLTVTENGLVMVGLSPKVHHVSWHDARLFAIDSLFGVKNQPAPIVFELSSANDIIQWAWFRPKIRNVLFFTKPVASHEEYNQQMQALLSLIAARTGLPLYDLRESQEVNVGKKQSRWRMRTGR